MQVPLHYQVSEYDCVPTTFVNAIAYLFERESIPPLVIRHVYAYSLDTVSRGGRLGRAGTSKYAIQLLGSWLAAYKTRKFSVTTEYLPPERVHVRRGSRIIACLRERGVGLCQLHLGRGEWHSVLAMSADQDWLRFFDPYHRRSVRGLGNRVRVLQPEGPREPNLAIRRDWLDQDAPERFCLGHRSSRECLLIWRMR